MNRHFLLPLLLLFALGMEAGEIVVREGVSLNDALRQAREWRRTNDVRCQGGITIRLQPGSHYMQEPLFIRPEDSGTETSPLVIQGETGAIICGDPRQQHTQLWPTEGMERMIGFDTATRTITIPTPPRSILKKLQKEEHLEMVVHQRWAIAILRVKALTVHGDSVAVTFLEPESRLEFEHPWPQPVIGGERGNSSFLLRTTEQRDGIERLVCIDGTYNHPVEHVQLQGLTFENTCWNRPLHLGHVTLQGGFPLVDAYKLAVPGLPWDSTLENQAWIERPVSAVSVNYGNHISIKDCHFRHLGATALDFKSGEWSQIEGCTFEDIGGTAIMAGSFAESPREVHRPYGDLAGYCSALVIKGNAISNATVEDWGAVGIGCGYVNAVIIDGNTVNHVNYSGICVGWGWTPAYTGAENNHIINNRVSDYARQLYDAGGIYTLSYQPWSTISGNVVSQPTAAPYATNDRAFCIYLDARTDGFTLENNTTVNNSVLSGFPAEGTVVGGFAADTRPIRRDEIGDNHPGPNLIFR
ncbi:MAG: right-handed parallel beta-helix repeat-containing protein [Prevotella sp.]|nr:right-handed parallel beta-helix repeat-containing protein [Prevotella sp.]